MIKKLKDIYFKNKFKADLLLGEYVYKNRAGFEMNRRGRNRWRSNQRVYNKVEKTKYPLGYHLFSLLNNEQLNNVISKYAHIIKDPNHTFIYDQNGRTAAADKGKFFMIKNVIETVPEVLTLLSPDIMEILYQYYQSHFQMTHIAAYRTSHLTFDENSKEVYAYKLHYDRHPTDTLKLFVNLSDVTPNDGPFNFFDRQLSKKILKNGYKERDNYGNAAELINRDDLQVVLTGKPGTAAICDTSTCLHKAGIPGKDRTRDLLVFSFESFNKPFDLTSDAFKEDIRQKIQSEHNQYK